MEYPAEVRLEVYDAIIEYAASGRLSELKPLAKMAFSFIRKEIDSNNAKYDETVKKRSEAGKKGMASRYGSRETADGDESCQAGPEDTGDSESLTKLTKANKANKANKRQQKVTKLTNVTDNVYDSDNVSTVVDVDRRAGAHEPPTPPERLLDSEIDELKRDEVWIDALRTLHHADADALRARLDDFRLHCAASGLEGGHPGGLRDAKQHFNSWLRVRAAGGRKEAESTRRTQADADRLAAEERAEAERKRERDRFTPPPGYTSLTWYREIKRRAEAGDPEAQETLAGENG